MGASNARLTPSDAGRPVRETRCTEVTPNGAVTHFRSPRSPHRSDLLWFPTGGGKTEAYLGLTAFTMAIRRLQPRFGELDAAAGIAVMMRYTLRLLTIQQFERAATLICAAEVLRRDDLATWGDHPFRIGM